MVSTIFRTLLLLLILSFSSLTLATLSTYSEHRSIIDVDQHDSSHHNNDRKINSNPKIYTYFERIPIERRFTDMSDNDDEELLDFWKESWEAAGWEPVVLGLKDAQLHRRFSEYEATIQALQLEDFYAISLRRYIAMATVLSSSISNSNSNSVNNENINNDGGGWMCDYDVFPMRDFRTEPMPHGGEFTIHGTVSATLASGVAVHWERTLQALLDNAQQHMPSVPNSIFDNETEVPQKQIVFQKNMWSDTLGLYHLLRNATTRVHSFRLVMAGVMLVSDPPPWDPETFCTKRQFRKKYRVVHMNVQSLLMATSSFLPSQRLPKHRAAVAREVIPLYEKYCGVKIREDGKNATSDK